MRTRCLALAALLFLIPKVGSGADSCILRGQVVDPDGHPAADVTVEIHPKDKPSPMFKRATNAKGGYIQVGLPTGAFTVTFTKSGYEMAGFDVTLDAVGLTEAPKFTLKPAAAAVTAASAAEIPDKMAGQLKETLAQAMEALKAGQWQKAEASYKELTAAAPTSPSLHFNLGYVYREQAKWPEAEAEFVRVTELDPKRSDALIALAGALTAQRKNDAALKRLEAAAPSFPDDPRFLFTLAQMRRNVGQDDRAVEAFHRVLELQPDNPEVQYYLGTLALARNDVKEATSRLQSYVSLTGQDPQNLATAKALLQSLKPAAK